MEPFKVHILGCGSALPTLRHAPTSQIVEVRGCLYMVDCGEGTQLQLRHSRLAFTRLQAIFISHLHGDHCFGLIGLISTFGMLGRTAPLYVYGPAALGPVLQAQLDTFCQGLEYKVSFHAVSTSVQETVYEGHGISVTTIPLDHRVACTGYLFREKASLPHIRRDMIDFLHIPISQINNIKAGASWTDADGRLWPHEKLVTPAAAPRSYAFCSDTRYMPSLASMVKGVDLLYHESTYDDAHADRARLYYHSTARQAALVAREAGAKQLLLGHYSARYNDEQVLLREAKEEFDATQLSAEGMVVGV